MLQGATLTVLAPATVALTFGSGQSVGTFGQLCKTPVTAIANVTGVTGYATPTGNVTLALKASDVSLHPAYTITVQTVRLPSPSQGFSLRLAAKNLACLSRCSQLSSMLFFPAMFCNNDVHATSPWR